MKKVLFALVLLLVFASCTKDETDEFDIFSPDKDKQECTGCDNGVG